MAFAPIVATGTVHCARCQKLIRGDERWDLGHVDGDPTRYTGPEHARCNRVAGAKLGNAIMRAIRGQPPVTASRRW